MRYFLLASLLASSLLLSAQCPSLLWSDEFDGNSLNTDDWNYLVGDGCDFGICGWGNNEQQWYQEDNVTVSNGILSITARQENVGGRFYSSSRITTKDKQDFRYGYLEARIKLPAGRGLWPAFWMLPTDEVYGGWPRSGEIDIMEWVGRDPNKLFGTIHFGQAFPNNQFTGGDILLTDESWADDFHDYAIEWSENTIVWYVDGYEYSRKTVGNLNGQNWPFDQDFHFLLNVAVGGTLGGSVINSDLPAAMEVDYVRVYDARPAALVGSRAADEGDTFVYATSGLPDGSTVTWTGPDGATVTPSATVEGRAEVTFGSATGYVTATVSGPCGEYTLRTQVTVTASSEQRYDFSFENFDDEAEAIYVFSNGTLTEVDNPAPDALNGSDLSGRYVRDAGSQFDVIVYEVPTLANGDDYLGEENGFRMDVFSTANPGREILLQLETPAAQGDNYPTGRHSRYRAQTTVSNEWERLTFTLLDQPDGNASGTAVSKMILLFEPNVATGTTFFYDNLDSYSLNPSALNVVRQLDFPLTASPNPAGERTNLHFTLPQAGNFNLSVIDLQGRIVLRQNSLRGTGSAQTLPLDMTTLPQGIYLVRLQLAEGSRTVRVVKR